MGIIHKVHPTDINKIKYLYALFNDFMLPKNKNFTFDTFMECRDGIYIYIDECCEFSPKPDIHGFIACRRTHMDDIKIDDLLFYPQPNEIIYSVEAFYIFKHDADEKRRDIVKELLNVIVVDKNDSFISVKLFDDIDGTHDNIVIDELINHGLYINKYDNGIHIFTKRPTVQTNFSF